MRLLELSEFNGLKRAGRIPAVSYRQYLMRWDDPVFDPDANAPAVDGHRAAVAKAQTLARSGLGGPALRKKLMAIRVVEKDDPGPALTPREAADLAHELWRSGRYADIKAALAAVGQ